MVILINSFEQITKECIEPHDQLHPTCYIGKHCKISGTRCLCRVYNVCNKSSNFYTKINDANKIKVFFQLDMGMSNRMRQTSLQSIRGLISYV